MIDQATLRHIREQNEAKRIDEIHELMQERWPTVPMDKFQEAGLDAEKLSDVVADYITDDRATVVDEVREFAALGSKFWSSPAAATAKTKELAGKALQQSPGTSMTAVFVAGLAAGAVFSFLMAPAPKPPSSWERLRSW